MDDNNLELDEQEELDYPIDVSKGHSQIFAFVLEVR